MKREECLKVLNDFRDLDVVVVTTMGSVGPWSKISQSELDFHSAGSAMGHAADFAMGIAIAQPQRQVWVLNGDGSMLMSLGTMVTICQTPPSNFVLFVLQNDTFEVTGNQPIPGAGQLSMVKLAEGAGFKQVYEFDCPDDLAVRLPALLAISGPTFVNLRIERGQELPPMLDCALREPTAELRAVLIRSN